MPNDGAETSLHNIVVLIDQMTRDTVDSIVFDGLNKHSTIITDIKEVSEAYMDADLVIFEPAVPLIVTPEILDELVANVRVKPHLIYQHEDIVAMMLDRCHSLRLDYSEISWNLVYAAVKYDMAILEPYQRSVKVIDSFRNVSDRLPPDLKEYFTRWRGSYMDLASAHRQIIAENAQLAEKLDIQEKIGAQSVAGLLELRQLLADAQSRCNAYEALLSKSYDRVKAGFFPDRPRVLYIKSISHVAGVDTLISTLFSALTLQYKASTKVVKLVDAGSALQLRYIPNYYVPLRDSFNTSQLLQNDFVLKLGSYAMMFDNLLLNRSGLEYLIVHDLRSTVNCALDASLIDLRLNEMTADYAAAGEYENVLSDTKKAQFTWNWREVQKQSGSRSVRLVNHPTVTLILDLYI